MKQGQVLKGQTFERYFMAELETVDAVVVEQVNEFQLLVDIGDERHNVDFSIDGTMRSNGIVEGDNVPEWQSTAIPVYRCGGENAARKALIALVLVAYKMKYCFDVNLHKDGIFRSAIGNLNFARIDDITTAIHGEYLVIYDHGYTIDRLPLIAPEVIAYLSTTERA